LENAVGSGLSRSGCSRFSRCRARPRMGARPSPEAPARSPRWRGVTVRQTEQRAVWGARLPRSPLERRNWQRAPRAKREGAGASHRLRRASARRFLYRSNVARLPETGDVVLGKYRIVRVLGRGGMGVVFEAMNVATEGRVALKLLSPDLGDSADWSSRM